MKVMIIALGILVLIITAVLFSCFLLSGRLSRNEENKQFKDEAN